MEVRRSSFKRCLFDNLFGFAWAVCDRLCFEKDSVSAPPNADVMFRDVKDQYCPGTKFAECKVCVMCRATTLSKAQKANRAKAKRKMMAEILQKKKGLPGMDSAMLNKVVEKAIHISDSANRRHVDSVEAAQPQAAVLVDGARQRVIGEAASPQAGAPPEAVRMPLLPPAAALLGGVAGAASLQGSPTPVYPAELAEVHLRNGVYMAKKHLANCLSKGNTDSKFIGLVARGLWRADELLDRSVSGKACRRLVKDGATAKEELTPIKVDAMEATQTQTITGFAEDVLRLCARADPRATEEKKLRIIMRGVRDDIFDGLRLPGVAALRPSSSDLASSIPGIREIIRDVVREELRKLLPAADRPASLSISDVVREEVQRAIQPEAPISVAVPTEPTLTYAAVVRRPPPPPSTYVAPHRRQSPAPQHDRRHDDQV
ncbi:hypothetical protein HPB47_001138 [Ixodes persulcatus]|uniref:Uncharacterized protein n=1 Tax=Ixodes persulcatus TaxID=34615 RepID=A0AC60PPV2_IXOPE|nr:hypothetical protein HPB47_001138 [Ixodes persulcatus]